MMPHSLIRFLFSWHAYQAVIDYLTEVYRGLREQTADYLQVFAFKQGGGEAMRLLTGAISNSTSSSTTSCAG